MKTFIPFRTNKLVFYFSFLFLYFFSHTLKAGSFTEMIDHLSSDETLIPYEIGIASAIIFLALLFFMKWEKKKEKQRISELQKRQAKKQVKQKGK